MTALPRIDLGPNRVRIHAIALAISAGENRGRAGAVPGATHDDESRPVVSASGARYIRMQAGGQYASGFSRFFLSFPASHSAFRDPPFSTGTCSGGRGRMRIGPPGRKHPMTAEWRAVLRGWDGPSEARRSEVLRWLRGCRNRPASSLRRVRRSRPLFSRPQRLKGMSPFFGDCRAAFAGSRADPEAERHICRMQPMLRVTYERAEQRQRGFDVVDRPLCPDLSARKISLIRRRLQNRVRRRFATAAIP